MVLKLKCITMKEILKNPKYSKIKVLGVTGFVR